MLRRLKATAGLTMCTTHHSSLKTLKYSDPAFENACESLKFETFSFTKFMRTERDRLQYKSEGLPADERPQHGALCAHTFRSRYTDHNSRCPSFEHRECAQRAVLDTPAACGL